MKIPFQFRRNVAPRSTVAVSNDRDWLSRILDTLANVLLAFTKQAGMFRILILIILVFMTYLLVGFLNTPRDEWMLAILAVFNPSRVPEIQQPFLHLITFLFQVYVSTSMIGHLIAFALPLWLAWQFAAVFLDDIFELKDIPVARRFIWRAAFPYPLTNVMRIQEGDVVAADKRSPLFRIGGPGSVLVGLENVAVFEKADGEAHLVGPTDESQNFRQEIEGFEHLQKVISVRDQSPKTIDVFARTKDGIPIRIHNVRILFSVLRNNQPSTLLRPYPYSEDAIMRLVYDQTKESWTTAITTLVRSDLVALISKSTLAEIFATVGAPEIQHQFQRQQILQEYAANSTQTPDIPENDSASPDANATEAENLSEFPVTNPAGPTKVARPQISNRFYQRFTSDFPNRARQRGVQLSWIDVGTWHPPTAAERLLDQHEEAFRLTSENVILNDPSVIEDLCRQEQAEEMLRLIRQPLFRFYQLSKAGETDEKKIADLIGEYYGILESTWNTLKGEGKPVPSYLETALNHIKRYRREDAFRGGHKM